MRALKFLLLTLISLIALLTLTVVVVTTIIDPNDYKADIESIVADKTALKLTIKGDLSWSFLPLGVDLNDVELVQKDGQPFTRLKRLTAQVGLLSLLRADPQVRKVVLDGLEVTLKKNEKGEANWENIGGQQETAATKPTPTQPDEKTASAAEPGIETSKERDLKLEISEIAITNTTIHYIDDQNNQSVSLKGFKLLANQIKLGHEFPLSMAFSVANRSPRLDVTAEINAAITVDSALKNFKVRNLESRYRLSGEPFQAKEVNASLNGNLISANLNQDTLKLDKIALTLANLALHSNLSVTHLSNQPKLDGSVSISDFSLQALLSALGQPGIETTDETVLRKLAFSSEIKGDAENLQLSKLKIILDDTRYSGALNYRAAGQFVGANIKGSAINIDRYLPPAPPIETQVAQAAGAVTPTEMKAKPAASSTKQPEAEAPLLPLETIRALNLNITFNQQQLIAKNLKLNDLKLLLKAEHGVISLTEASGKLYDGSVMVNGKIDAKTDNPKWLISNKVDNIQIMPLLKDLQNMEIISGGLNLDADLKSTGNTLSALRSAAKGDANFELREGALHGVNLTQLTCEGFALINRDKVTKRDWSETTEFESMQGRLTIDGNNITNNNLTAALSGMALNGNGVIDTAALNIDYRADLKAVGNLGDNACRVSERVKDLAIPVVCQGSLMEDPAQLCQLDYNRVEGLAIELGKKELKRKADKAIDKKLNKFLGDDDSETKKGVKKLLKGLF